MSPFIFAPTPLPHDVRSWLGVVPMLVIAIILDRRGEPRSVTVWMVLGFVVGLIYRHANVGGAIGAVIGIASARVNSRKRF